MNQSQAPQEAKQILEKYFNINIYNVRESLEMGRGALYSEENAIKAILEHSSSKDKEIERLQNKCEKYAAMVYDLQHPKLQQATASSSSGERGDGELIKEIDRLQEKYDENGFDFPPIIKLQRIDQHIDSLLSPLPHPSTKEFSREELLKWIDKQLTHLRGESPLSIGEFRSGRIYQLEHFRDKLQSLPSSHTEVKEGREVEFAEWMRENNWTFHVYDNKTGVTLWKYRRTIHDKYDIKSTQELFQLFLNQPLNK